MQDLSYVLESSKNIDSTWYNGEELLRNKIKTSNWTEGLFGFKDRKIFSGSQVDMKKTLDELLTKTCFYKKEEGIILTPKGNYHPGWFVAPTVNDILQMVNNLLNGAYIKEGEQTGRILTGVDANKNIFEGGSFTRHMAASQFNSLEMISQWSTPYDGINGYISDNTQGPAVALAGAPGTFVRNYNVMSELGGQFNALEGIGLSHLNGYLMWGDKPGSVLDVIRQVDTMNIRIPAMLYTQVAGAKGGTREIVAANKLTHQIYLSSAPKNSYGNTGDNKLQDEIIEKILTAEYMGAIGLHIILGLYDGVNFGVKEETLNVTLVGTGAFNNPIDLSIRAFKKAMEPFNRIGYSITFHDYTGKGKEELSRLLGLPKDGNYGKFNSSPGSTPGKMGSPDETGEARRTRFVDNPPEPSLESVPNLEILLGVSDKLLDERSFAIFSRLHYKLNQTEDEKVEYDNYIKLLNIRYQHYVVNGNTSIDEFLRSDLPTSWLYEGFEGIGVILTHYKDSYYIMTKQGKTWLPKPYQMDFINEFFKSQDTYYRYTYEDVKVILVKIFIDDYPYIYFINQDLDISYILTNVHFDGLDPSAIFITGNMNDDWSYNLYTRQGGLLKYEDLRHAEITADDRLFLTGHGGIIRTHGTHLPVGNFNLP
jgi:hypothetical protein